MASQNIGTSSATKKKGRYSNTHFKEDKQQYRVGTQADKGRGPSLEQDQGSFVAERGGDHTEGRVVSGLRVASMFNCIDHGIGGRVEVWTYRGHQP